MASPSLLQAAKMSAVPLFRWERNTLVKWQDGHSEQGSNEIPKQHYPKGISGEPQVQVTHVILNFVVRTLKER